MKRVALCMALTAIVMLLMVAVRPLVVDLRSRDFNTSVAERAEFNRLRLADAHIATAMLASTQADLTPIAVADAVLRIGRNVGWSVFRSGADSSAWLAVNPDPRVWDRGPQTNEEVVLYSPHRFQTNERQGAWILIGRSGTGERVDLRSAPDWTPLPLEELSKQGIHTLIPP